MKPERRRPQSGKAQKINTENRAMPLLLKLLGRVPTGRASTDYATLQNILRMVPLRVLRIPRAIYLCWIMVRATPSARANRARFARLLLRNEPNPAYPYRGFIRIVYKCLSRLVKPASRRPHSGKAQIKNNLKNMIWAMPSARAALVLFILKIG